MILRKKQFMLTIAAEIFSVLLIREIIVLLQKLITSARVLLDYMKLPDMMIFYERRIPCLQ